MRWKWGAYDAEGVICKVYTDRVERTLKGARVVHDGEPDVPAYLIEQDNGARILKKHSEVTRA